MIRSTMLRAVLVATVLALVLPAAVLAAKPIAHFHDHFTETFSSELCGIAVDVELVATDNFTEYADGTFKDTSSFRQTFTNPANGHAVMINSAGQLKGTSVVDVDAGTITFSSTYKGLPEQIKLPHGRVLLRDAGIITFADTFDLDTGDFIGSVVTMHGPHPEADSDFAALCEVVVPILS